MTAQHLAPSSPQFAPIVDRVQEVWRELIAPLGARFSFDPGPSPGEVAGPPTVLLIGNHSSGKSTFINYLLGEDVQKTGHAPTDDSFTVIAHGGSHAERDGRALVTDPDAPWDGLAAFGPALLSHLRERRAPSPRLRRVTLIDTPGMIDAAREDSGRGYDFAGVVRWFAERADLILLFFDPDKPGTTGETLDVYTRALVDLDHKLRVVMNKVDRFGSLTDFARAYGALCWNLARVSPRKDLPLIYTTFVPVPGAAPPSLPAGDFVSSRDELAAAVDAAPSLRAHNLVTRLLEHAERLEMHARVVDEVARAVGRTRRRGWLSLVLGSLVGVGATAAAALAGAPWWGPALAGAMTALGLFAGWSLTQREVARALERAIEGLDAVMARSYGAELLVRSRADDLHARWEGLRERTRRTLAALGSDALPRLSRRERAALREIVAETVPALRREVAEAEVEGPTGEAIA